jgi:hypothetical protein
VHRESRTLALAAAIVAATPAGAAVAGEWEIEIHGGGPWTFTPSGGRASPLSPGETFEAIVPGVSSRCVTILARLTVTLGVFLRF